MGLLAAVLAIALAAAVAIIVLRDRRAGRELDALERELRETVPRSELSAALASRDAVMAAASAPILLFDTDGGRIAGFDFFVDPNLFPLFDLPIHLDA